MGGMGSGRHSGVCCTAEYRQLDVRRWQRDNYLEPGRRFSWQWTRGGEQIASINVTTEERRVILDYRHRSNSEDWISERYPVWLDWTQCHYGGQRAWFLCPARGCRRRVAILYGGTIFACRRCYRLAYPSQRESASDRMTRRADKIRNRLDWEPGILNGNGLKPKGMHWKTFEKLETMHDAFAEASIAGAMFRFGISLD